jgi:hypothetical protein
LTRKRQNATIIIYDFELKNYEDFINALANGTSVKDLCGQFGICKSTAYNWIKKHSLIKRTKERTISVHRIYQLERENQKCRLIEALPQWVI